MSPEGLTHEQPVSAVRTEEERKELIDRLGSIIRIVSGRMDTEIITEIPQEHIPGLLAKGTDLKTVWFATCEHDPHTNKRTKEIVRIPPEIPETEIVAKGKAAHEAVHIRVTRYHEFIPGEVMQKLGFSALMAAAEERPTDQGVRKYFPPATEWIDEARKDSAGEVDENTGQNFQAQSLYSQLCSLIVYEPHFTPEHKKLMAPEVLDAYDRIKEAIEKMEHTLPRENAEPGEETKEAIERYKIIYKEVWPVAQEILEKDRKKRELAQTFNEHKEKILENLSLEERQALEQMMLQQIIEQLQTLLKEIFSNLPAEEKIRIQKSVRKEMEDEEDDLVKKYVGQLLQNTGESHKQFRARIQTESKKTVQKPKREPKQKISPAEKTKITESSKYEAAFQRVRPQVDALYHRLEEIFHPNIDRSTQLRTTGNRPSLPQIFRRNAARAAGAREIPNRIFEKLTTPEKRDYAFAFGFDTSWSMKRRMKQVLDTAVVVNEALNRAELQFLTFAFDEDIKLYKGIEEKFSDDHRQRLGMMDRDLAPSTNTDDAILFASQELEKVDASQKFILICTDGDPNSIPLTKEAIQIVSTREAQHLLGLGLGSRTKNVAGLFPHGIPNIQDDELVTVVSNVLENMVLFPEEYL